MFDDRVVVAAVTGSLIVTDKGKTRGNRINSREREVHIKIQALMVKQREEGMKEMVPPYSLCLFLQFILRLLLAIVHSFLQMTPYRALTLDEHPPQVHYIC